MSNADFKLCLKQDSCPLLLAAIEAKVKAESELRVWNSCWNPHKELEALRAAHEELRASSNRLFVLASTVREKQRIYYAIDAARYDDKHRALIDSRLAERQLDSFLTSLKIAAAERKKISQPDLFQQQ